MRCYIAVAPIGMVAVNEKKELIAYKFFDRANAFKEFESALANGQNFMEFVDELKAKGFEVDTSKENLACEWLKENFREIALKEFAKEKELNSFLNQFCIELTRKRISSLQRKDKLIIQVISAIKDLDKILNLMSERLREWYGLHYPEFEATHEKYAKAIINFGKRENFENFYFSIGMGFSEKDIEAVKEFARAFLMLYGLRENLEKYLEGLAKAEIPNLTEILGYSLASRLLASAGSLEKLAKMPSSTIQLLGAEKALFRFLRTKGKTKPPKHGLIFLSPYVSQAPKDLRGKIARLLAAKLALAARMDYYTKENKGKELKKDLEEKIKELREGK
jgi:nucleolar protein 56